MRSILFSSADALHHQRGVTLVEMLASISILTILILGLLFTYASASRLGQVTEYEIAATNGARDILSKVAYKARTHTELNPLALAEGADVVEYTGIDALIRFTRTGANDVNEATTWFNPGDEVGLTTISDAQTAGSLDEGEGRAKLFHLILHLNESDVPVDLGATPALEGDTLGALDLNGDGDTNDDFSSMVATDGVYPVQALPIELEVVFKTSLGEVTLSQYLLLSRMQEDDE